jgi:hypothetical protein
MCGYNNNFTAINYEITPIYFQVWHHHKHDFIFIIWN